MEPVGIHDIHHPPTDNELRTHNIQHAPAHDLIQQGRYREAAQMYRQLSVRSNNARLIPLYETTARQLDFTQRMRDAGVREALRPYHERGGLCLAQDVRMSPVAGQFVTSDSGRIHMSQLSAKFEKAAKDVKALPKRPDNETLLKLYALYKQSTAGDVSGSRPGMFDLEGRAKYDARTRLKGTGNEDAMKAYVDLVEKLKKG